MHQMLLLRLLDIRKRKEISMCCPFCDKYTVEIVHRQQGYEERCTSCGASSNVMQIEPQRTKVKLNRLSYAEEKQMIFKEDYYSHQNIQW